MSLKMNREDFFFNGVFAMVILVFVLIAALFVGNIIYNLNSDPITRVGQVVDKERHSHTDEDGWRIHYYYATIQYDDPPETITYTVSEDEYHRLFLNKKYLVTTKGTWTTRISPYQEKHEDVGKISSQGEIDY